MVLILPLCAITRSGDHRDLHSFPTRRSSDLKSTPVECADKLDYFWRQDRSPDDAREVNENIAAAERFAGECEQQSGRILRSEEHTSELQSRRDLVCRLLLEKKKSSGASNHV